MYLHTSTKGSDYNMKCMVTSEPTHLYNKVYKVGISVKYWKVSVKTRTEYNTRDIGNMNGYCFRVEKDTEINTTKGWKKFIDLKVGDELILCDCAVKKEKCEVIII